MRSTAHASDHNILLFCVVCRADYKSSIVIFSDEENKNTNYHCVVNLPMKTAWKVSTNISFQCFLTMV